MNHRRLVLTYRVAFGIAAILLTIGVAFALVTAHGDIVSRVRELVVVLAGAGYGDLEYLAEVGAIVGVTCVTISACSFGLGCLVAFVDWLVGRDRATNQSVVADQ